MFFRRAAKGENPAMKSAAEKLSLWQDHFARLEASTDAGEKYFALRALGAEADALLAQEPFSKIAKALHPDWQTKVWAEAGTGSAAMAAGGVMTVLGGPLGIAYGATAICGGLMGWGCAASDAISRARNKKLYLENRTLIDGLYGLRQKAAGSALETRRDLKAHPDMIPRSSKCDALLGLPELHSAFTAAAKAHMRGEMAPEPKHPPKPGNPFHL